MEAQKLRKPNRLPNFDYTQNGAYFVTICTKDRKPLLWESITQELHSVGALTERLPLSNAGKTVEQTILNIPKIYSGITLSNFVVMPNHIHLLLLFHQTEDWDSSLETEKRRSLSAPTESRPAKLSEVIKHLKGFVTRGLGANIWQKGYYDHVIRNDTDFQMVWKYIDENPLKWQLDCYFTP